MKINHAILHILDFESAVNVISQRELDLEDSRACRQFVTTHLRRARESGDNKRATFSEESAFGSELKSYFYGERDFIDLSQQVADFIGGELSRADKAQSTDILVADFDDDDDVRWFAVMLLSSKQAFMHEVGTDAGQTVNGIARHYAILPNPSQKLQSYCVVRASTMEIGYVDKKRKIINGNGNGVRRALRAVLSMVGRKRNLACKLKRRERRARIARSKHADCLDSVVRNGERTIKALRRDDGVTDNASDVLIAEVFKLNDTPARKKCRIDLKVGIFRRGTDHDHGTVLNCMEQGVLL